MLPTEISFVEGTVRVGGEPVHIPRKELELLFTVAAAGTLRGEELMDALWPDLDGDAAHNAFRVCLHRLRKRMNNGSIIRRAGNAYRLDDGIVVDLHRLRAAGFRHPDESLREIRAGSSSRMRLGGWFERFERLLWSCPQRAQRRRASDIL